MNTLFSLVEPLPTTETLANYWHFLKSIDSKDREALGPIEVILKYRAVARGWPVGLKNQTLALLTEVHISEKSALVFLDITEVSSVTFSEVHRILPFVSDGAISRSPLERRMDYKEAKDQLLHALEELKKVWPAKIYFDADPMSHGVDELMNLSEVLRSLQTAVRKHQDSPLILEEMRTMSAIHISDSSEMKGIALFRRDSGEVELTFHFSRALPKKIDETISSLFVSMF